MPTKPTMIPSERIERAILLIRGQKVMLDADLAALYGVDTRSLVQAVRRNIDRFPADFMFRLTAEETKALRSQVVISKPSRDSGRAHLRFQNETSNSSAESESTNLRSQTVISSESHGGRRYAPYAFTEQGVAMLSSVLHSPRAVAVNIDRSPRPRTSPRPSATPLHAVERGLHLERGSRMDVLA